MCVIVQPAFHLVILYLILRVLEVKSAGGDIRDALMCGSDTLASKFGGIPEGNPNVPADEDEDVSAERKRVEELERSVASDKVGRDSIEML